MNWKRFLLAFVAVFVASNLLGYLIHERILALDYLSVSQLWRVPEQQRGYVPFIWLANGFYALAFVAIYAKGMEDKPWPQQGLRFGIWAWLLSQVPGFTISYAVQPLPPNLTLKQIGYSLIASGLLGMLAAALYRDKGARTLRSTAATS